MEASPVISALIRNVFVFSVLLSLHVVVTFSSLVELNADGTKAGAAPGSPVSLTPPSPGVSVVTTLSGVWTGSELHPHSPASSEHCLILNQRLINTFGFGKLDKEIFLTTLTHIFHLCDRGTSSHTAKCHWNPFLVRKTPPKIPRYFQRPSPESSTNTCDKHFKAPYPMTRVLCWQFLSFPTKDNIDRSSSPQSDKATHNLLKEDSVKDEH